MVPALSGSGPDLRHSKNKKRSKSRDVQTGVVLSSAAPFSLQKTTAPKTVARLLFSQITLVRFGNEQQSDDHCHDRERNRVPQSEIDIARLRDHRKRRRG